MPDTKTLINQTTKFITNAAGNYLDSEDAARHGLTGLKLFDDPLMGFAQADDPLFHKMKEKGVVGPQYMTPDQWLPGAKTVISVFFPFSESVRKSNVQKDDIPSDSWLFGRIEGQQFIDEVSIFIAEFLQKQNYQALVPNLSPRFQSVTVPRMDLQGEWEGASFTSNWSERHAAYICGLGTFGLSRGLITKKGMAGRFCSVITSAHFPPTPRAYTGIYDYCIRCGACARRCPMGAISLEHGKDHIKCAKFQATAKKLYAPRYGCGKCQVGVPCEAAIPRKALRS